MKAKGVPDIEARVKQAVESESDSDTGAKGAVLGLNLNQPKKDETEEEKMLRKQISIEESARIAASSDDDG